MLTVFTPTYNRKKTLVRLYHSLLNQTCKNFEWLIVDDGSIDGTTELVQSYIEENEIIIRYIFQKNAGKMQAHNNGVKNANGDFFVCVDSDDYLVDDAVEIILANINNVPTNCAGIIAMKGADFNTPIKGKFMPHIDVSSLGGLYDSGYEGDTTIIFATSVILKFPFPKISGEKFIPEAYIYDQIDIQYKYKILNKVLTICEYRNDGYTNSVSKLIYKNPNGWLLWYNQSMKFKKKIKDKFLFAIRYVSVAIIAGKKHYIKSSNSKFLAIFAYLPGVLLAKKRVKENKK